MRSLRRCISPIAAVCVVALVTACSTPGTRAPAVDEDARARFDAALADLEAGRWSDAAERFEALLDRHPDAPHAWRNLAIARERLGDSAGARAAFEAALRVDGNDCAAHVGLGLIERRAGHLDASERHYRACLAVQPDHAAALVNLGILQEIYLQRAPEALANYQRYLMSHEDAEVAAWIEALTSQRTAYAQK